ncbi:MAG: NADH-quinone oxidoreductase subunit NuoN [Methylobacteriaceae bacterium]|jgi:NADH-quinone oxidoreductase subunit N|nr:NADH-quinone oxidoreductase subunit NuoN [Methylobacteriaceae bacterium]
MSEINAFIAFPEIILVIGVLILIVFGALRKGQATETVNLFSLIVLAGAFIAVILMPSGAGFGGLMVVDSFAKIMKALALIAAAATIAMSRDYMARENLHHFEFPILVTLAAIGMMMMISANNLLGLYLGIELLSLPCYVLAAFRRDSPLSTEAGVKYFVLGSLSSGMLLYGASLIYGFSGSLQFPEISAAVKSFSAEGGTAVGPTVGLITGMCFMAAGTAFKISAVPFHMWTPDVYEGSPAPVTAFFASAPKVAGLAVVVRLFVGAFGDAVSLWQQIIYFISVMSMIIGAFGALTQSNFKRLMAYSSIGNVGYALIGLVAGTEEGIAGMVVYLVIYVAMTLGAFACIIAMRNGEEEFDSIYDLAGLSKTHGGWAAGLLVVMFSLAAIPPLGGFFGKLMVFMAAVKVQLWTLVIVGVLTSVVSAFYYLRIVKIMYFDEPHQDFETMPVTLKVILAASNVVIVLGVVFMGFIFGAANMAAGSLW